MSITIFDSTTRRSSSTAQDMLNDLAEFVEDIVEGYGGDIVRDEKTGNVDQIYITPSIYINITTASTPGLRINHTNGVAKTWGGVLSTYFIVKTDTVVLVYKGGDSQYLAIAPTVDPIGNGGCGIYTRTNASTYDGYIFTERMTTNQNTMSIGASAKIASFYWTALTPIYSLQSNERFIDDLMRVLQYKSTDGGKCTIDGENYYLTPSTTYGGVAIKYYDDE